MQYTRYFTVASRWVCCAARFDFFGRVTSKEREQVLAHSDIFVGTAWYPEVEPHHWCKAVGLRRDDSPAYLDAIATNLAGKNESAFTLAAIEKTRGKIAGYVLCCAPDKKSPETLSVVHLKVDTEYQRRGVGTMLLAAAENEDGNATKPGFQCWPRIDVPETATRNQGSNKYRALLSSLKKASSMKCNGSRWHVQSKTQRLQGAGRGLGLGSASAPTEDEIPAHRRSDILQLTQL